MVAISGRALSLSLGSVLLAPFRDGRGAQWKWRAVVSHHMIPTTPLHHMHSRIVFQLCWVCCLGLLFRAQELAPVLFFFYLVPLPAPIHFTSRIRPVCFARLPHRFLGHLCFPYTHRKRKQLQLEKHFLGETVKSNLQAKQNELKKDIRLIMLHFSLQTLLKNRLIFLIISIFSDT